MQTLLTLTWSHAGVTAYAPVIVVLTSFSLLDLTLVLPSALIALNVPEQLKAIQRAKRWDWTLLFQWDLGCNPPPCWIISSQRRGGLRWHCHDICFQQEIMGLLLTALLSAVGIWMSSVGVRGCTVGRMCHRMLTWGGCPFIHSTLSFNV